MQSLKKIHAWAQMQDPLCAQNHLVSIESSLARDTGNYLVNTFTGFGTVYIVS